MPHLSSRILLYKETLNISGLELLGYNRTTKAHGPMELHTHPNCIEMVFVLKGSETYHVNHTDYIISRGDVFITYPGELHSNGPHPQGVSEFIWIQLNLSETNNFLGLDHTYTTPFLNALTNLNTHILNADKDILSLLQKSFNAFNSDNSEYKIYGLGLLISLLFKLIYLPPQKSSPNAIIQTITHYISENINDSITLEQLCKIGNLSLSTLQHQFKDYIGQSPRDYINCQKIEHSKKLLQRGLSVTEVAMMLSFSTSDYFATTFKKYTAQTPSEYINGLSKSP